MRALNKFGLPVILYFISCNTLNAQDAGSIEMKHQADSLQRISMRDSLNFNDRIITQIYGIRDSMMNNVLLLRNDFSIPDSEREIKVIDLRNQANENIRQLLGNDKYKNYIKMVRSRSKRSTNTNQSPLAGDTVGN